MSAEDAIRAREAAKRPPPPEPPPKEETHGRKAVEGDTSRPEAPGEPEPAATEAPDTEEVDPEWQSS